MLAVHVHLGLGAARLGQPHTHIDAGVLKVERVRVALRTVADDGDLFGLNEGEIGVLIVEGLWHGVSPYMECDRAKAAWGKDRLPEDRVQTQPRLKDPRESC